MSTALSIGKLARIADVKVSTIRFYEQIGLLPEAERTGSDRRIYDDAAVRRLSFIKHARQLGFSVEAIRVLLALSDDPTGPVRRPTPWRRSSWWRSRRRSRASRRCATSCAAWPRRAARAAPATVG